MAATPVKMTQATHTEYAEEYKRDSSSVNAKGVDLHQTITMSQEQFERLYLSSKEVVVGDLGKTFGNPAPVALAGFVVALLPISIQLMGWRGSGGGAAATSMVNVWFGCGLLWIAGLLEFFLGHTFQFVVFMGYGAHLMVLTTTSIPWFNAIAPYTADGAGGMPQFYASFGFYPVCMTLLSFLFLVCSIRTNIFFVLIFLTVTCGCGTTAASYFAMAQGDMDAGTDLLVATGAFLFVSSVLGWYVLASILLSTMDLPSLPLFDLSTKVRGVSERAAAKAARHNA